MLPNVKFVLIFTSVKQPPALSSHLLCFPCVAAKLNTGLTGLSEKLSQKISKVYQEKSETEFDLYYRYNSLYKFFPIYMGMCVLTTLIMQKDSRNCNQTVKEKPKNILFISIFILSISLRTTCVTKHVQSIYTVKPNFAIWTKP